MIKKEEIKHIASLARLELSEEEIEKMSDQLSDVISYIEKLKEVDVAGIEPTAQVTGLENSVCEDEVREWNKEELEAAVSQAPEREGEEFKVRRVLEEE